MNQTYFCSADERWYLEDLRNQAIKIRDRALTMKPGTAAYEAAEIHDGRAKLMDAALEVFQVRPGSQRSSDGSCELSAQFQRDFDAFLAERRKEREEAEEAD